MSEEHPLSLVEQVTPIIDLMARTSTHFARLKDFINLRFPPGFPVKIGEWKNEKEEQSPTPQFLKLNPVQHKICICNVMLQLEY